MRKGLARQSKTLGLTVSPTLLATADEVIWLHDLGYFDLEQKTLQPLDNPFGPRLSPMS